MQKLFKYFENPVLRHVLFWAMVYLYFILSVNSAINFVSDRHFYECYGLLVTAQITTAYICIYLLIPKFLDKKQIFRFALGMFILLICVYAAHTAAKTYYLDAKYAMLYNSLAKQNAEIPYLIRLTAVSSFLSRCVVFLTPTALLLMFHFYKNQQKLLKLNEQKKIAELSALRNQLNPHFLFNTLNNLYALALDKSEKTPEVIERLSDILDYILYRCKADYVPIGKEIELIENYIALEKIRYGNRVSVNFDHKIEAEAKIAPLLILTFVENAFKHGVSQELKKADIDISLTADESEILFLIRNTKPKNNQGQHPEQEEALGLKNVRQQLELLYPDSHNLAIDDNKDCYRARLKLKRK